MCATRARRSRWQRASAGANSALPGSPPCCRCCCCRRSRLCSAACICRTGDALAGAHVPAADRRLYRRLPRRHAATLGSRLLLRAAVQLFLIRHPRPAACRRCLLRPTRRRSRRPAADRRASALAVARRDAGHCQPPAARRCLAEALHPQPLFDERLLEIDFRRMGRQPWEQIDRRCSTPGLPMCCTSSRRAANRRRCCRRASSTASTVCAETASRWSPTPAPSAPCSAHWLQLPIGEWSRLPLAFRQHHAARNRCRRQAGRRRQGQALRGYAARASCATSTAETELAGRAQRSQAAVSRADGAARAGSSAVRGRHGYRSASSRCPNGRAAAARHADRRHD
jgi:hypothetical protein